MSKNAETLDRQKITGTTLWIQVPTELDHHSAERICQEADKLVKERDIEEIVFDFSDTIFCDSSGIGMLMGRYKMMKALGGTVRAVQVPRRVGKILMLSGIMKIMTVEAKEGGMQDA